MSDVLTQLAREILMVDENNQSMIPEYDRIIREGLKDQLPDKCKKRDVIIIGAGIAGMLTGKILKDAGYNITILEANDERVGGRVKTIHPEKGKHPFKNPNQYAEAGAMRIPDSSVHPLVNTLMEVLDLDRLKQVFYNVDVSKGNDKEQTYRTWLKTNGVQARKVQYNERDLGDSLTMGFPIPKKFQDFTASQLLDMALEEPKSWVSKDLPIQEQVDGWVRVIETYGDYNMSSYLREFFNSQGVENARV